jgi:hypothetical protein
LHDQNSLQDAIQSAGSLCFSDRPPTFGRGNRNCIEVIACTKGIVQVTVGGVGGLIHLAEGELLIIPRMVWRRVTGVLENDSVLYFYRDVRSENVDAVMADDYDDYMYKTVGKVIGPW